MMFDEYEIDREMLLNKTGDVTEEGEYVTPYRDPNKRFGASLGKMVLTEKGKYVTPYRVPNKRFGASLGKIVLAEGGEYLTAYRDPNKRFGASLGKIVLTEGRGIRHSLQRSKQEIWSITG
jgi:hypothetical protein